MQIPFFTSQQSPTFISKLALSVMHGLGWKIRYNGLPTAHGVMIFYPHTSNWDFVYGMLTKLAITFPLKFLVKEKLFHGVTGFFIGGFVRFCGGEPIERGVSSGAIPKLAQRMQQADWFWLALTPEGTRSYTDYWRSGFYHIALTAKVPLACAYIDYEKKEIGICQFLDLTGDEAADLAQIQTAYQHVHGKYQQQQGKITFKN
jgi:1-acyl-sn-glycerol-3-phosphate acyltransferase